MATAKQIEGVTRDSFASSPAYPIPALEQKNRLECPYVFWFSKKKNYVDFPSTIKNFSTINTVQEFWQTYAHIPRPSELPDSNMLLFVDGVEPLWEKNPGGGHWQLVLNKGLVSRCWEELILAMTGQQFPVNPLEISGIGVSARKDKDWITIWNKSGSDEQVVESICSSVRELLKLPSHIKLTYRKNNEFPQWNSIQEQGKILRAIGRRDFD